MWKKVISQREKIVLFLKLVMCLTYMATKVDFKEVLSWRNVQNMVSSKHKFTTHSSLFFHNKIRDTIILRHSVWTENKYIQNILLPLSVCWQVWFIYISVYTQIYIYIHLVYIQVYICISLSKVGFLKINMSWNDVTASTVLIKTNTSFFCNSSNNITRVKRKN